MQGDKSWTRSAGPVSKCCCCMGQRGASTKGQGTWPSMTPASPLCGMLHCSTIDFSTGHSQLWCICSMSPALGQKDVACKARTASRGRRKTSYTRAGQNLFLKLNSGPNPAERSLGLTPQGRDRTGISAGSGRAAPFLPP